VQKERVLRDGNRGDSAAGDPDAQVGAAPGLGGGGGRVRPRRRAGQHVGGHLRSLARIRTGTG